ncbi:MAG: metallophosphoesterase [Clostridia bacterium]|nr:metallophosphoesterase [Clostridia bacterium]
MKVFAIADLHLPAGDDKPMDIFGPHWERHFERICEDWREKVTDDDVVLLPGDISWAMRLSDAKGDLDAIGALKGIKILTRGNHDYWWNSISRVREALTGRTYALQNDALRVGDVLFAGTRGWILPAEGVQADDIKIYERECARLRLSLEAARRIDKNLPLICMLHYPPLTDEKRDTEMTRLLKEFGVSHAVYGHLHGPSLYGAFRGVHDGIEYHQVSCDGLGFKLKAIYEF